MPESVDRESALILLDRLLEMKDKGRTRLLKLLKDPKADSNDTWAFHISAAFNTALDVQYTPRKESGRTVYRWTQGALFSFDVGDILYDTPKAYDGWEPARIGVALQVKSASKALTNGPGSVTFQVLRPSRDGSRLERNETRTTTQDGFLRILIAGLSTTK